MLHTLQCIVLTKQNMICWRAKPNPVFSSSALHLSQVFPEERKRCLCWVGGAVGGAVGAGGAVGVLDIGAAQCDTRRGPLHCVPQKSRDILDSARDHFTPKWKYAMRRETKSWRRPVVCCPVRWISAGYSDRIYLRFATMKKAKPASFAIPN